MQTESPKGPRARVGPARPKNPQNYVVWLLSQREWSKTELLTRLRQRGLSEDEALAAIEFSRKHGLQSDERYAESKSRYEGKRHGNRAVKTALAAAGIDADQIARQLDALPEELTRAIEVAKRFEGLPFDIKLQQKAYRFLASRGFTGDVVKKVLRHLKAGAPFASDTSDSDDGFSF